MDNGVKLEVLKNIATKFNNLNITWALGASMLLYFKGIINSFNDIDIMVANDDVHLVNEILINIGELKAPNPNYKFKTKTFLEFIVNGVEIDVMAGFTIVNNNELIDCSLQKNQIVEFYNLDKVLIPLQSLDLWCKYYQLMGRNDKVEMIKNYLNQ